jgi:D-aminopeptidase
MRQPQQPEQPRGRIRDLGIVPGVLPPGPLNAITDVAGVRVGHLILPHGDNLFQSRVPAGLAVGNGFGKLTGVTQLVELGELETPLVLANTLAVPRAADALISYTLGQPGNEVVRSVNPVVGECNDGLLNDIRARAVMRSYCGPLWRLPLPFGRECCSPMQSAHFHFPSDKVGVAKLSSTGPTSRL